MGEHPWIIRAPVPGDVPFVMSSWLASFWDTGLARSGLSKGAFQDVHRRLVNAIVQRAPCAVASWESDPSVILGWVCFELHPNILHYVYVKEPFRQSGIASSLIESVFPGHLDVMVTHKTPKWELVASRFEGKRFEFNPYVVGGT